MAEENDVNVNELAEENQVTKNTTTSATSNYKELEESRSG